MTATADETTAAISRPGVYDGLPESVYHRDPVAGGSLSSSGARKLLAPSCPALFRHEQLHGQPHKPAFDFGRAAHEEVLGTGGGIEVVDAADWRTADAKKARDAAYEAGKTPLLPKDYKVVQAMAEQLKRHPIAGRLFQPGTGKPEQSLFWKDPATGVICRARLDWLPTQVKGRRLIIGDYKGLALDTPIPTPTGWTNMGELKVGDKVFDAAGKPCKVTAKSEVHFRKCYRMRFDDGSEVVCDDEHLWVTTTGRGGRYGTKTAVANTEQIKQTQKLYGQNQHRIKVAGALELPEADLPIHPYVFGCWLGDGHTDSGRISKPDAELFDRIEACGYEVGPEWDNPTRVTTRTAYGLQTQLRKAGLLGRRHIPDAYLRASREQRAQLLRGLMDTDGSWNQTRQQAVFTSTDKGLAASVRELALSLGQRAVFHEVEQKGFGLVITAYRVTFTPTGGLNPFALSRKADAVEVRSELKSTRRVVVAVEEMPTVHTQCITVDSPDSTYLCTEAMVPTHNTCRSAEPREIAKAVHEHGYHQQDDFYRRGARELGIGGPDTSFVFVFQAKTAPYLVTVVELDLVARQIGRERNDIALKTYKNCVETGHWPGFSEDIELLSLPVWAERQHEEDYQ